MRFFTDDTFNIDIQKEGIDVYNKALDKAVIEYWDEFEKNVSRFPKNFCKAYKKHGFHDNTISKLSVVKRDLKPPIKYNIELYLIDYYNENIIHSIILYNVRCLKGDIDFIDALEIHWQESEFLPINDKIISLEVNLFKSNFYIEFERLIYKQIKE